MSNSRCCLVVDDSRMMRRVLVGMATKMGFDCVEANDGSEAIEVAEHAIERGDLTLVLSDWHMPGMSGIDFVRHLRSEPRFDSVRVLMVTSEAEISSIDEALSAGVDEYLMKPFDSEGLAAKLDMLGLFDAVC